jgi:hypothetical protein
MQTIKDYIIKAIEFSRKDLKNQPLALEKVYKDFVNFHGIPKRKLTKYLDSTKRNRADTVKVAPIAYTWSEEELSILHTICNYHRVLLSQVLSNSRKREVNDCRKQAMVLFYVYFDHTTVTVGNMFMRDHSTILHALETHNNLLQTNVRYCRIFKKILDHLQSEVPDSFIILKPKEKTSHGTKFLERTRWSAILREQIDEQIN